nr:hypothetical protein [uncultured Halomonas sp.]
MHSRLADTTIRPMVAIGTDYRPGTLLDFHTHRRAQFLYGMTGVMELNTDDGTWMVPPYSGGQAAPSAYERGEHPKPVYRAPCRATRFEQL